MPDSKISAIRFWKPNESAVERAPNLLQAAHEQPGIMCHPHWHAQVEINYVVRGAVHYRMHTGEVRLEQGTLALFWGGLPHQVIDTSDHTDYVVIHLPLMHFFRLRLPLEVRHRLMHGATLTTLADEAGDYANFDRWAAYMRSGDPRRADHAIDELLLRIERVLFEPYKLFNTDAEKAGAHQPIDQQSFHNIGAICNYIAENFRHDIDSGDIASSADIHPKYAMSVFKKSTGMTLNDYVSLLRLSYAQALLVHENANILHVAMESGFGSLSAFNKSFRKIAGESPTDFRKRSRPGTAGLH